MVPSSSGGDRFHLQVTLGGRRLRIADVSASSFGLLDVAAHVDSAGLEVDVLDEEPADLARMQPNVRADSDRQLVAVVGRPSQLL